MATFFDDFNRANGSLGGNWVTCNANPAIAGGLAGGDAYHEAANTTVSGRDYIRATATVIYAMGNTYSPGPAVKMANGSSGCYLCSATYATGTITFQLYRKTTSSLTSLASTAWSQSQPSYYTYQITYDHGTLTATFDGGHSITANDTTYATQDYAGYASRYALYGISSITISGETGPALDVSPSVVGNYGNTTELTFTGTDTAWTSGTPGAPTFTCDHGTLSDQSVASTTSATATYDPGDYLGTVVFTDPTTGQTDSVLVTSNPNTVPPSGTVFSQAVVDYLERSAVAEDDAYILNRTTDITVTSDETSAMFGMYQTKRSVTQTDYAPDGDPAVSALAYLLWQLVNGTTEPATGPWQHASGVPLSEQLGDILERWATLITANEYTLGTVITTLTGEGAHTHADILTAIEGIEAGETDLTPVLDAIAALRGDTVSTVAQLVDILGQIRTLSSYTLGSVKTWVEGVQGSGLPTIKAVMDRLAEIQPTTANSLDDILTKVVSESTLDSLLDAAVLAVGGEAGATIAAVLDAIAELSALVQAGPGETGPVWPGEYNVEYGQEVSLSDGLTVDGPLDGLLVHIATAPAKAGRYGFGAVNSWTHCGAVIFASDHGDCEIAQPIGLDDQVIVPRAMAHAAYAIVRLTAGYTGTVTPWTISTGE